MVKVRVISDVLRWRFRRVGLRPSRHMPVARVLGQCVCPQCFRHAPSPSATHLGRVIDGVAEGEKRVRGETDSGQLRHEHLLLFCGQGLRRNLEVGRPHDPLEGGDVSFDVPVA